MSLVHYPLDILKIFCYYFTGRTTQTNSCNIFMNKLQTANNIKNAFNIVFNLIKPENSIHILNFKWIFTTVCSFNSSQLQNVLMVIVVKK